MAPLRLEARANDGLATLRIPLSRIETHRAKWSPLVTTCIRLLRYLRPYWLTVAATWLLSLLIVGLQVLSVWVAAIIVERILVPAGPATALAPDIGFAIQPLDRFVRSLLRQATPFRSLLVAAGIVFGS
jgi:hypothetical protein